MKSKLYLLAVLFISAFVLMSCNSSTDSEPEKQEEEQHGRSDVVELTAGQGELMKIVTGQPERRQLTGYITAPAKIEAIPTRIADIGTLISGRVTQIYVQEGERVKKGQVLLEIQGLEIGEIKGEFIRTQAALNSAEANFKRQERLRQENIAAEKAYIEAKSAYQEARAAFSAADQKLHSIGISDAEAESLLSLATSQEKHAIQAPTATLKVQSPISGTVSKFSVMLGQLVDPDTDIMEVLDNNQVWLVADIYEKNLASIRMGQRVEITTEAWPGVLYSGKIEYIAPVVNDETRTVKVRSTIENGDGALKPEMFATMRIFSTISEAAVVVPEAAVQNDGESDFVFVRVSEGEEDASDGHGNAGDHGETSRYRKVLVQSGIRQDGIVEIKAGLTGTETIVVSGAFFLKSELMKESFGEHGH